MLGIMKNWAFPAKSISLKPASVLLHNSLGVLVRFDSAQNAFRVAPSPGLWDFKFNQINFYAE